MDTLLIFLLLAVFYVLPEILKQRRRGQLPPVPDTRRRLPEKGKGDSEGKPAAEQEYRSTPKNVPPLRTIPPFPGTEALEKSAAASGPGLPAPAPLSEQASRAPEETTPYLAPEQVIMGLIYEEILQPPVALRKRKNWTALRPR